MTREEIIARNRAALDRARELIDRCSPPVVYPPVPYPDCNCTYCGPVRRGEPPLPGPVDIGEQWRREWRAGR